MKNIFFFDNLITPKILVLFYWLSLACITLGGLFSIQVTGFSLYQLIIMIFGCIGTRVAFELIMIAFNNNEYLRRIAEQHGK
ncbi:DUF4282 domain-containing protein [Erwinia sp.]|uniref:DUF4282 domain-containing protein n=1 Tax=Erwinia citreus TaxID=558 RepID=UPI003C77CF75